MSRIYAAAVSLLILAAAAARAEAADEIGVWPGLNWGDSLGQLDETFGARLTVLDPPWQFGPFEAPRLLPDKALGEVPYRVLFQMAGGAEGLQQILLERRHAAATPLAFEKTLRFLEQNHGPPSELCLTSRWRTQTGDPAVAEARWQLAGEKLHLSFLNFQSSEILYLDPSQPIDPLVPEAERRIIHPNLMPQRILLRIYPADRPELDRPLGCPASD